MLKLHNVSEGGGFCRGTFLVQFFVRLQRQQRTDVLQPCHSDQ